MDPLTQGLLGAAAAQALLGDQLGRKAWLIGAAGGMLPDADVFIRSDADPLLEVEYHRGFTHALAFIPVGGAVASLPWLLREKYRDQWKPILGGAVAAYATHGLLDACTTYGTQLYWPFSSTRAAWNCISIVDPIFTLILLVGVVWAAWVKRRAPAAIALGLCLMYLGLGVVQRERAQAVQERVALARNDDMVRGEVFPTIANLVVWRSLYQAGDSLHADRIRAPFFAEPMWTSGTAVADLSLEDLPRELRAEERIAEDFRRFHWFSGGWVARAPTDPDVIGDVRYSLATDAFDPVWGIRFNPNETPPTQWVNRTDAREMRLSDLLAEIRGENPDYRPVPVP